MNENKIYIVGHKSPDLDSVAGAISYADFKNTIEKTDKYVPVLAGASNEETEFALKKFGFEKPAILENAKDQNVILVDHNEFSQAVDGIGEANILEVLDHHKVDFKYNEPIKFLVEPWGASCSIIAQMYFDKGIEISKDLAGLMLSAILVDTVITKSPTCVEKDKEIIEKLAKLAGIEDWQDLGMELFKVCSSVKELSAEEIIKSDFRDFNFKAGKVGIGQAETVDLSEFSEKEEELLNELDKLRKEGEYHSALLLITDIIKEGSLFLVSSENQDKVKEALGAKLEKNRVYIDGIISRKKQVVPKFTDVFDR